MLEFSQEHRMIRDEIANLCSDFEDEYWRSVDRDARYPYEFVEALAEHGWLGTAIPEEYGGAGLDTMEGAIVLEEIAASGAGINGAMSCHGAMFIPRSIINNGSEEMKERVLPELASGEKYLQCFALTEPNAGFESTAITTRAERDGDTYVVNGQKVWTSRYHASDYMVLVARTTPLSGVERHTDGISLFLVNLDDADAQGQSRTERSRRTSGRPSHPTRSGSRISRYRQRTSSAKKVRDFTRSSTD
jgi:acyl-CoA dehydrogenase